MPKNPQTHVQFTRINDKPIIKPDTSLDWEAGGVFAPAVLYENGIWKMLYRACGTDQISRFGYAESDDGIKWTKDKKPRVVPENFNLEYSGIEDPRIVNIDGEYLIVYTGYAKTRRHIQTRIRLLKSYDLRHFKRTTLYLGYRRRNGKNGVLFPKKVCNRFILLHRREPDIQISSSRDLYRWSKHTTILRPTFHKWETLKIGAGTPPIKTPLGWLIFYHGVSALMEYSMGAAVLDLFSPKKVLYRLPYPLITPSKSYEKTGVVPNVIFGTSAIEYEDTYRLYYGAADKVIAAAYIDRKTLLKALRQHPVN
jgi:predicted GH43/DUF377 family glycosyl hydrolase